MGSGGGQNKRSYVISGHWDPMDGVFVGLNQETRDRKVFMTVAIDLVISECLNCLYYHTPKGNYPHLVLEICWCVVSITNFNAVFQSYIIVSASSLFLALFPNTGGIQEPVRFLIETQVRIYPQNERFWYFSKKPLIHLFSLKLKQVREGVDRCCMKQVCLSSIRSGKISLITAASL